MMPGRRSSFNIRRGVSTAYNGVAFTPLALFTSGTTGVWYDPSDNTTVFSDNGVTQAVNGSRVYLLKDKSGNGWDMVMATTANQPYYRISGTKRWLEFNQTSSTTQHMATSSSAVTVSLATSHGFFLFQQKGFTGNTFQRMYSYGQASGGDTVATTVMTIYQQGTAANERNFGIRGSTSSTMDPYLLTTTTASALGTYEYDITSSTASVLYNNSTTGAVNDTAYTAMTSTNGRMAISAAVTSNSPVTTSYAIIDFYGYTHVGRALTASELTNMRSWCNTKLGL
jgi:hypothetical protein